MLQIQAVLDRLEKADHVYNSRECECGQNG